MTKLIVGQKVVISGAAGVSHGEVIDIITPAGHLPVVRPDGPDPELVRSIMREFGIQQAALIEFLHNGEPCCFFAFGDGAGKWCDLQQQPLTIRPHGQEN